MKTPEWSFDQNGSFVLRTARTNRKAPGGADVRRGTHARAWTELPLARKGLGWTTPSLLFSTCVLYAAANLAGKAKQRDAGDV
jgi:hypothetical protein